MERGFSGLMRGCRGALATDDARALCLRQPRNNGRPWARARSQGSAAGQQMSELLGCLHRQLANAPGCPPRSARELHASC